MTAAIAPGSDQWMQLVTASKVSTILGVSPYDSPRALWLRMRGDIPREQQTTVQARGKFLEAGVLDWYFADHPDLTRAGGELTILDDRLPWAAATPDDLATTADLCETYPVDAKTDGRGDPAWGEPGTDQVPLHLIPQAIWVMHLGGWKRFVFTRLGPWLERDDYEVTYDAQLAADIEARCHTFWQSLGAGEPPPLDTSVHTYDAIRSSVPVGDGDWDCPPELAHELCNARAAVDQAEAAHNLARSRVLAAMGDAKRVVIGDPQRPTVLGQKQKTKTGTALYPPRRPVDIATLPTATTEEAA